MRVRILFDGVVIFGRKQPKKYCHHRAECVSKRFVTLFWPKKVKAAKLEEIHAKMVSKEAGSANGSEGPPKKKPKLNGSSSSSSLKINGKSVL